MMLALGLLVKLISLGFCASLDLICIIFFLMTQSVSGCCSIPPSFETPQSPGSENSGMHIDCHQPAPLARLVRLSVALLPVGYLEVPFSPLKTVFARNFRRLSLCIAADQLV